MKRLARAAILVIVIAFPSSSGATTLTTTHYRLDPNVAGTFGGLGASTHYGLVDVGGEAAIGFGSSPSYKLGSGYVAQLAQSIQLAVLPSGVTSYYPLDTGIGVQAYDSSASNNTGTTHNNPSWVTGQIGQALSFDGSTQYVSTTTPYSNPTALSIELWFKTTTSQGGLLAGFGDAQTGGSSNTDRLVYLDNAGHIIFGANPGTKHTVISPGTYSDDAWHHVVATLGASGMALYVDGSSVGTDANTAAKNMSGYWRLAYDNLSGWPSAPTSNFFSGSLDEIKIYNRSLNATEVLNEYTAGAAGIVSAQTIPQISAGASKTSLTDAIVTTDGPGYNLAISQDHNLTHTDTVTTIPAVGSSITSPAVWSEGTTKGLGFTLTSGTQLEGKWGTSPNYDYAALPTVDTTFHSRSGFTSGNPETTTMQFRLDVPSTQKSGKYSNTVTISATVIP